MPDKAIIYNRVSTTDQDPESQEDKCRQMCKTRGWKICSVEREKKSGYKNVRREKYEHIIELARQGEIQHIVVWALDRWTRKGGVNLLEETHSLACYGVKLHSVQEAFLDELTSTSEMMKHFRNFMIGFLGWMAQQESSKKGERVKDSKKFIKAKDEKRVGRPKIPKWVKTVIIELLKENIPYDGIKSQVHYRDNKGRFKVPSEAYVSLVRKSYFKKRRQKI